MPVLLDAARPQSRDARYGLVERAYPTAQILPPSATSSTRHGMTTPLPTLRESSVEQVPRLPSSIPFPLDDRGSQFPRPKPAGRDVFCLLKQAGGSRKRCEMWAPGVGLNPQLEPATNGVNSLRKPRFNGCLGEPSHT